MWDLRHQPFEDSRLADGYFDVAVGNVPFGNYTPFDPRFKKWGFLIHDYFFAKAIEKVRPGGIVLFVTSRGTMDKNDGSLRSYAAHQADLLGAIRLPNTAFKQNANTEVTTDIIVLRKRQVGELPGGASWRVIAEVTNNAGEVIPVNEYFAAHPHLMLGEMRLEGNAYGGNEPTLVDSPENFCHHDANGVLSCMSESINNDDSVFAPIGFIRAHRFRNVDERGVSCGHSRRPE